MDDKIIKEWLDALNTQYQLCSDYMVKARASADAPTSRQLWNIREAHLNIIPILKELAQLRAEREGLIQWVEEQSAVMCVPETQWNSGYMAALLDFKSKLTESAKEG